MHARYMLLSISSPAPASGQGPLLEARSTNIARTIATLRGVLSGLYPAAPTGPHMPAGAVEPPQPQGQGQGQTEPFRVTTSGAPGVLYQGTLCCGCLGTGSRSYFPGLCTSHFSHCLWPPCVQATWTRSCLQTRAPAPTWRRSAHWRGEQGKVRNQHTMQLLFGYAHGP